MVFSKYFSQDKAQGKAGSHKNNDSQKSSEANFNHKNKRNTSKSVGKRPRSEDDSATTHKARSSKKNKIQPSEDALQLSAKLKEFSRNKNLGDALKEYWHESNDKIRDGHHACIMVDCSARCGKISEGEKIIEQSKNSGNHINIETKTALLKGYVHSGDMLKADKLFVSMCDAKGKNDLPNVRSLNTLLRGCLWCSASLDEDGVMSGGVITSEKAWDLYKNLQEKGRVASDFDVSSFEYSISLLCQALRTEEAESRIKELKMLFGVSEDLASTAQSVAESLSVSYLALARAYAILEQRDKAESACRLAIDFAKRSKVALKTGNATDDDHRKKGKDISDSRRLESNAIYREHRLSEVETEATTIKEIVSKTTEEEPNPRQLARRLLLRLLVLAGGGTTDSEFGRLTPPSDLAKGVEIQNRLVNTAYFSYGLDVALKRMGFEFESRKESLRKRDCNRILGSVGLQGGIVHETGLVDFRRIFHAGTGKSKSRKRNKKQRSLEVELGSGFGDWIVKKAIASPEKDFLAVELRADRVGQTFARTSILSSCSPIENLCSVGAESGSLLLENVDNESVSKIYINHPEPPTQTFGAEMTNLEAIMDGGKEPAHMVSSRTIVAAAHCLTKSPESRLVIVTDNKWYGLLICATLVRVARENPELLFQVDLTKHNYQSIESFPVDAVNHNSIHLFEGQPDESIGHSKEPLKGKGASYFDRLWRSGAGSHAERRSRFIIVMARGPLG